MASSILITLMGSLGDVARGLTLVAPIKKKFPESRISWLVEPKCLELVRLHPLIDRIVVFERGRGLNGVTQLFRKLQEEKYDLCLDLQRHLKSAIFSRLSGAGRTIGFSRENSKEFNWLFSGEKIPFCPENLPKIEHYWKFLEYLDIPAPGSAKVELELGDSEAALSKFGLNSGDRYLVLVLGSSWKSKDWPANGYQKLVEHISAVDPNLRFVLCGGNEHLDLARQICDANEKKDTTLVNACSATTLRELCILIKMSRAVVGPYSGPGHLAALLEVPFTGLYGPTSPERTAPYGSKVKILTYPVGCSPCYRRECPGLNRICMRLISPQSVANSVLSQI